MKNFINNSLKIGGNPTVKDYLIVQLLLFTLMDLLFSGTRL